MIRFRKREALWDFAEVTRTCRSCGKKYTYYAYRGSNVYHSCLECDKCKQKLWYYPEEDSVLDKYFGDQDKRDHKRMDETLERLASPCTCGGNYHHIAAGEAGVPKNCPLCSAPEEKDDLFMYDRGIETISPKRKKYPVAVLEFYDDAFPDFSDAAHEQLLEALKKSDPEYVQHALGAIYRSRKPFPYQEELIHLLRKWTSNRSIRRNCVELLGKQGDTSAVPVLIEMLNDKDHLVRTSAQSSLLWLTSQVIPQELAGSVGGSLPQEKVPKTVNEWRHWWQENKDTIRIRDYPPDFKARMGLA